MGTIIGMSGGNCQAIERFVVKLANKNEPKVLLVPTAANDAWQCMLGGYELFGKSFGCKVDFLPLSYGGLSDEDIRSKILSADIIYVGGGSAFNMMETWRQFKVDQYMKEAYDKDIILTGTSAGAICWFKYGNGDSNFTRENKLVKYRKVVGCGLVDTICYPHYYSGHDEYFEKLMRFYDVPAIALEDNTAIFIKDDKYLIIKTEDNAKAYKFTNRNGIIMKKCIVKEHFCSIKELIEK
jgi:dipeptidase E